MPVDTTRVIPTRRTQRKITEEELKDIELKRIRGELSCAECRRLKLRCDKKVPCSSCCRRGCESICPCGILSAGQGTRFILADTEQLHRKITEMSNRIRQLEDALAILQSTISDQRHPLLQDELLRIKFGAEALDARHACENNGNDTTQPIDALGTLTLGECGEVKYYGRSAGSETLMMASEEFENMSDDEDDGESCMPLSPALENLANLFPFTKKNRANEKSLEVIESFLPPNERAWALCNSYLNHAAYFFRPIKSDELLNSLLPNVYKAASIRVQRRVTADSSPGADQADETGSFDSSSPHALATLFFLFALGALLDLTLAPYNADADQFYDLGRAALSLRTVYESPSVETVQAMGLMATYHSLAGKKYSRDSAWSLMSFVAKLAQSIGLHRDSARWHMDATTVQMRRNLFWEVFAADVSHSLALGRPPAIHLSYVDCEFPLDEEATLSDTGENQSGFWRIKHTFGRDVFNAVAEATLTAKSPSYSTVLNLDRKVREISFPAAFKAYVLREDGEEEYHSSSLSLRGFYASQHRTVTMIYLHRSFFAQAMLDHPTNPLLSPFAPSFLTAYRCASVIIKASAHQFDRCAPMAMRIWFLLYHTFSAAVIVGTVVTRSPNSGIAANALLDLDLALSLFERTAVQSYRARVALGVLRKLKEKAVRSYIQNRSSILPSATNGITNTADFATFGLSQDGNDVEDELSIFGGQTRLLDRKATRSKHSPTSAHSSTPSPQRSMSPASSQDNRSGSGTTIPDVHPSLVEFLTQESRRTLRIPPSPPQQNATMMNVDSNPQYVHSVESQRQPDPTMSSSGKQMGDMFSSFVDYLANRSFSGVSPSAASPEGSQISNNHGLRDNPSPSSAWQPSISPPVIASNNSPLSWLSPPRGPSGSDSGGSMSPSSRLVERFFCPPSTDALPDMVQGSNLNTEPPSASTGFNAYTPYPASSFSFFNTPANIVDPADTMVEMGLTSESGMDAAWMSFMQDCGIMDLAKQSS